MNYLIYILAIFGAISLLALAYVWLTDLYYDWECSVTKTVERELRELIVRVDKIERRKK